MLEYLIVYYYISVVFSVRLRVMSVLYIEFGSSCSSSIPVIRYVLTTEVTRLIIVTITCLLYGSRGDLIHTAWSRLRLCHVT